jgi:hypothetical protein
LGKSSLKKNTVGHVANVIAGAALRLCGRRLVLKFTGDQNGLRTFTLVRSHPFVKHFT